MIKHVLTVPLNENTWRRTYRIQKGRRLLLTTSSDINPDLQDDHERTWGGILQCHNSDCTWCNDTDAVKTLFLSDEFKQYVDWYSDENQNKSFSFAEKDYIEVLHIIEKSLG